MNWRHSFARKREVHKNGENFSDNLGNEPVCRSCDSDSGNLLKSSGETLWGKMAVSGVACGGDTALRADTAEPAGANGDNAGTGAFGAEHERYWRREHRIILCRGIRQSRQSRQRRLPLRSRHRRKARKRGMPLIFFLHILMCCGLAVCLGFWLGRDGNIMIFGEC